MIEIICVYCGSSDKVNPEYLAGARQMGAAIARRGLVIVYGAGNTGLMGALANAALESGGKVIGIIPGIFNTPQLCHQSLTRLEIVETIQQRKARLAEIGDAFIAMPGGYGTFEELFEILTWAQIGLHEKPVGLLNTRLYFDPLLTLVQHALREGFIYAEHRALLTHAEDPDQLLDALMSHQHPAGLERWLTRED